MLYICGTMNNEGNLLKEYLKKNRMSVNKLAVLVGMARSSVYYQLDLPQLSASFVDKLNNIGITIFNPENSESTNFVQEKPTLYQKTNQNAVSINLSDFYLLNVPLIQEYAYSDYVANYMNENYLKQLPQIPFMTEKQDAKGNYVAFQVRGDSMNDGSINSYQQGDIVLCREITKEHWNNKLPINKWDFVIVHQTEGILLKKITHHNPDTGKLTAHSLNPFYDDMNINLNEVSQLFNIVKIERKK